MQCISGLGSRCIASASASSSNKSARPSGSTSRASSSRLRKSKTVVPRALATDMEQNTKTQELIELKVPTMDTLCDVEDEMEADYDDNYFSPEEGCTKDFEEVTLMAGELIKGDELESNLYHKFIVGLAASLAAVMMAKGISESETSHVIAAVVAGYFMADLGSGVFHWATDNYGNEKTPVLGGVIASFQGHHLYPWTITKREFANNIHKVATPTIPTLMLVLASPLSGAGDVFFSVFTVGVILSQHFHAWSHTRKSQLPKIVVKLQDAGFLISRKSHGAHHRLPFNSNYCIMSGTWNPLLDNYGFFRALEKQIHAYNGVEPRCWQEKPDYTWLTGSESSGKSQSSKRVQ